MLELIISFATVKSSKIALYPTVVLSTPKFVNLLLKLLYFSVNGTLATLSISFLTLVTCVSICDWVTSRVVSTLFAVVKTLWL